jgi:hypothetical protein
MFAMTLAAWYEKSGNLEEALRLYEKALASRREEYGAESLEHCEVLVALARVRVQDGVDPMPVLAEADAMLKELPPQHPLRIDAALTALAAGAAAQSQAAELGARIEKYYPMRSDLKERLREITETGVKGQHRA